VSLLEVRGLSIELPPMQQGAGGAAGGRRARALEALDLDLAAGEALALVGESGSGKTLTALALLDVLPPGLTAHGSIRLAGRELGQLAPAERRAVNGRELGLVFQEPSSALDPLFPIGEQIAEVLRRRPDVDRASVADQVIARLREVGMPDPEARAAAHPHELSGGQRQRAMLAVALAGDPSVLVADEPTSALDTALEAEVLGLLRRLQRQRGMGLLLITHDLAAVACTADRVAVLYAGRLVEEGPVEAVFARPRHPYTAALLDAARLRAEGVRHRESLSGAVPLPGAWPEGCRFHPRCPLAEPRCSAERPALEAQADGSPHLAACFHADEASR
jgi:oligopeptide/dipeptide ABC transporter ATP-binding protein